MKEPQISQKKIAEESGVSIMTVSRVLRGKDDVAPQTRERVLAVAQKHRYRPNLLVRGIQTGRTKTIGVMVPARPFYYKLLSGIHDELIEADHVPITIWSASDAVDSDIDAGELKQIHRLLDRRVDGVILKPIDEAVSDDYLNAVWERGIPLVVVDRELPQTHADFVGTDDHEGGKLVAEHLLELGHRRLAVLTLDNKEGTHVARQQGFAETIAHASGAQCVTLECHQDEDDEIRRCMVELLMRHPRPTAVFVPVDTAVPIIYDIAEDMRIEIPKSLSVVGFSNRESCRHLSPGLTTGEQFPYRIGRRAAKLLLNRCLGNLKEASPVRVRLKPELVLRESTAPPQESVEK